MSFDHIFFVALSVADAFAGAVNQLSLMSGQIALDAALKHAKSKELANLNP